ncbi:CvpA family protein [Candidatus Magnetaquicoccus inordinatus]|uniref:CvpA family protein n=1 Tax=Candidatus Magnetaquicoccus inordinatus TaxID=2496818 RepID=UPI00102CD47E|nr:CvpA family protein [Candidatus Magnetaquicoccus inordinatus]
MSNTLDTLIVIVLTVSGLLAAMRGFLREVIGLLGWVVAFVVASRFFGDFATVLANWIHQPYLTKPVAFFLIFFGMLLVFGFLGQRLQQLADHAGLSVADRLMGLCFGMARGLLILLIGFILFKHFNQGEPPGELMSQSVLAPYLQRGADWLAQLVGQDWVTTQSHSLQSNLGRIVRPASQP